MKHPLAIHVGRLSAVVSLLGSNWTGFAGGSSNHRPRLLLWPALAILWSRIELLQW